MPIILSSFDDHIAIADTVPEARIAYASESINTVLLPNPFAGLFNAAAKGLTAEQIDETVSLLVCLSPETRAQFQSLTPAQQNYVLTVKSKEDGFESIFNEVVGTSAFIDDRIYVVSRRELTRTAFPHVDDFDSHMAAVIVGKDGMILHKGDYEGVSLEAFETRRVIPPPHRWIEVNPNMLCFIKGTTHPHVQNSDTMTSRWHNSPVVKCNDTVRQSLFMGMR